MRNEFHILLGGEIKWCKCIGSFIYTFSSWYFDHYVFLLLLTKKRYYNNRWSFWAAILIRSSLGGGVGGWGGTHQSFIRGGSTLRSNPWPFYIPFLTEKDPFRLRSIDKCYPFHPHSLEIWTPFLTAVNALSLKHELITKLERFIDFFTPTKCICQPFRAFLQTEIYTYRPL